MRPPRSADIRQCGLVSLTLSPVASSRQPQATHAAPPCCPCLRSSPRTLRRTSYKPVIASMPTISFPRSRSAGTGSPRRSIVTRVRIHRYWRPSATRNTSIRRRFGCRSTLVYHQLTFFEAGRHPTRPLVSGMFGMRVVSAPRSNSGAAGRNGAPKIIILTTFDLDRTGDPLAAQLRAVEHEDRG